MSLFQAPVDEVRVLTGGVDIFTVLYARAEAAYPRGIWVEGFGTIKGGSIIELTGDKHRESVREATLSQWSATIVSDGDTREVRSVGTLTWREKRTPHALTGFLASARATHVTVRIREVEILHGEAALRVESSAQPAASPQPERPRTNAKPSPSKAKETRASARPSAPPAQDLDEIPIHRPPTPDIIAQESSDESSAQSVGWGDLEEASQRVETAPAAKPAETTSSVGWGDVAQVSESIQETPVKAPAIQPAQQSLIDGMDAAPSGWGEVAELSETIEQTTTQTAAKTLKRGEVLVHPKLGDCTIINVLSETVVMVKPRGAKARKISLKPFVVTETGKRGFYALTRA